MKEGTQNITWCHWTTIAQLYHGIVCQMEGVEKFWTSAGLQSENIGLHMNMKILLCNKQNIRFSKWKNKCEKERECYKIINKSLLLYIK